MTEKKSNRIFAFLKRIVTLLKKIPGIGHAVRWVDSKVAAKTLVAAITTFVAVVAILVYFSIQAQTYLLEEQEKTLLELQYGTLSGRIEETQKISLSLAIMMSHRPDVQAALADRDRKGVINTTSQTFAELREVLGKEIEGQLHIPKAISFLRYHQLDRYADDGSAFRQDVLNVNAGKQKYSTGIVGGRYVVAIRGVVPMFYEGELIGASEFGTNLSSEFLANLFKQYNITSAMYFDAKFTGNAPFLEELGKKVKGIEFYLYAHSWGKGQERQGAPNEIRRRVIQSGKDEIYYDNERNQVIKIAPLKNFAGQTMGTTEIYVDRTKVLADIAKNRNKSLLWGGVMILIGSFIIFTLIRFTVGKPVEEITAIYERIGLGDFTARSSIQTGDEMGTMASSLNAMLDNTLVLIQSSDERDRMQNSIMKLLDEISHLAEGDLTQKAEVTEDMTGAIADAFNDMIEQLTRVVKNVKEATIQVSSTSHEVSTSTEHLAEASEMQAVQVSDAIAAINEMTTSIQQVSENAAQCAAVSEKSVSHAKEGAGSVKNTNAAMEVIREHVQETARSIKRLGESSQEIGNIVQLINDIADRTSILALNASIQAAMAGEAGRGFAVVAEEVQRLAERSTNATKQIDTLIKNIQGEINEAGTSMEESIQRVVEGSKLADAAYAKLQDIESVSIQLGELIQSISLASKQQARASENIAKTMEEVGEISSQTSAASRQTAVSMKKMAETAEQLRVSVEIFKLAEEK